MATSRRLALGVGLIVITAAVTGGVIVWQPWQQSSDNDVSSSFCLKSSTWADSVRPFFEKISGSAVYTRTGLNEATSEYGNTDTVPVPNGRNQAERTDQQLMLDTLSAADNFLRATVSWVNVKEAIAAGTRVSQAEITQSKSDSDNSVGTANDKLRRLNSALDGDCAIAPLEIASN